MPTFTASIARRATIIASAAVMVAFSVGSIVTPASALPGGGLVRAPGDDLSVSVSGFQDFGFQRQGTTVTHTLTVLNDGLHDLTIDPTNLFGLAAPFSANTTISPADVIEPGESKVIVVSYAAPAATGTADMVTVNVPVYDELVLGDMVTLTLNLRGQALATDPAYFAAVPSSGGAMLDFGKLRLGGSSSAGLNVEVGGALPLTFSEAQVTALDFSGNPLPDVRVTASSFGSGATYNPGGTGSLELTIVPTKLGAYAGVIRIIANVVRLGGEDATVIVDVPLTAIVEAAAVDPTPTPTPTPNPTSTAVPPAALPGVAAGQQLAHTGSSPELAVGFGVLTLALGGIAFAITAGARRKARRG